MAQELGFGGIAENSLDAVSNRDFVLDYLAAAAMLDPPLAARCGDRALVEPGVRLLRSGGRLQLGVEPHAAEEEPRCRGTVRAKAPRVCTHLVAVHGVLHGLPLTYNKDLQEDKEPLFDAVDTLECACGWPPTCSRDHLPSRAHGLGGVRRLHRRDRRGRRPGAPGVPFREAHGIVGGLVRGAWRGEEPVRARATPSSPSWCRSSDARCETCSGPRAGSSPRSRRRHLGSPGARSARAGPARSTRRRVDRHPLGRGSSTSGR